MTASSTDDAWSFDLRSYDIFCSSSSPSPASSPPSLSTDAQLLKDIDLTSRNDDAQYKPNPWSIAKINAASRPKSDIALGITMGSLDKGKKLKKPKGLIVDFLKKQAEGAKDTKAGGLKPGLPLPDIPSSSKQNRIRPHSTNVSPVVTHPSVSSSKLFADLQVDINPVAEKLAPCSISDDHALDEFSLGIWPNDDLHASRTCEPAQPTYFTHQTAHIPTNTAYKQLTLDPGSVTHATLPTATSDSLYCISDSSDFSANNTHRLIDGVSPSVDVNPVSASDSIAFEPRTELVYSNKFTNNPESISLSSPERNFQLKRSYPAPPKSFSSPPRPPSNPSSFASNFSSTCRHRTWMPTSPALRPQVIEPLPRLDFVQANEVCAREDLDPHLQSYAHPVNQEPLETNRPSAYPYSSEHRVPFTDQSGAVSEDGAENTRYQREALRASTPVVTRHFVQPLPSPPTSSPHGPYQHSRPSFRTDLFATKRRRLSPTPSRLPPPRVQYRTPTDAYNHPAFEKSPDEEWSTLPSKRRQKLPAIGKGMLRKSGKFRIPLSLAGGSGEVGSRRVNSDAKPRESGGEGSSQRKVHLYRPPPRTADEVASTTSHSGNGTTRGKTAYHTTRVASLPSPPTSDVPLYPTDIDNDNDRVDGTEISVDFDTETVVARYAKVRRLGKEVRCVTILVISSLLSIIALVHFHSFFWPPQ